MKKTLYFFFVCLLVPFHTLLAQGNLQFNRVLIETLQGTLSTTNRFVSKTITVPAGKVWKIESGGFRYDTATDHSPLEAVSGFSYSVANHNLGYLTNSLVSQRFPIWLPEGSYTFETYFSLTNGPHPILATLSIIEFNITP